MKTIIYTLLFQAYLAIGLMTTGTMMIYPLCAKPFNPWIMISLVLSVMIYAASSMSVMNWLASKKIFE